MTEHRESATPPRMASGTLPLPPRLIAVPPCSSSPFPDKEYYRPLSHSLSGIGGTRHRLRPVDFLRRHPVADYAGRAVRYHPFISISRSSLYYTVGLSNGKELKYDRLGIFQGEISRAEAEAFEAEALAEADGTDVAEP